MKFLLVFNVGRPRGHNSMKPQFLKFLRPQSEALYSIISYQIHFTWLIVPSPLHEKIKSGFRIGWHCLFKIKQGFRKSFFNFHTGSYKKDKFLHDNAILYNPFLLSYMVLWHANSW